MTCIIGHRDGWIVADRRSTWQNIVRPVVVDKIVCGPGLLVAFAGDSAAKVRCRDLIASENLTVDERLGKLREALSGLDWEGIWVDGKRLGLLCKEGGNYECSGDYAAIGNGEEYAMGFLAAHGRVNPINAQAAIRACSTCRISVSPESTYMCLPGP